MNTIFNKEKEIKETKEYDPLKTLFHLGGTMIVDKGFDIRNYLNLMERGRSEKNKNFKNYNIYKTTTQFSTFNSNQKPIYDSYLSTFNNMPKVNKKFKKHGDAYSTDITKKYLKTNYTNLDYKNNITNYTNSYLNFLSTKHSTKLIYNKTNNISKKSPTQSNENFNIVKAIKEIKRSTRMPNIIKKSPHKKFFITKITNSDKNNPRPPLSYSKAYEDTVFDSKNLINNYNFRKGLELDPPEDLITFSTKKKEISVKNALIDLLNNESKKLSKKEKDFEIRNKNNKNIIDSNIKEFEKFTDDHKIVCKNIENCFDKLQKENNNLLNELMIYKSLNKSHVDEIQKLLEQIENLRAYALFVHHSLEKDTTRYEKNIFPDYRYEKLDDYDKKIEKIRNFVVNNYSIFWDNKYKEELKDELKFLEEPELLLNRFDEVEGNIMRLINFKNNLLNEMKEDENNHNLIINELKERYAKAEKEYKKLELNLNIENNFINNLKRKENDNNYEYISLIGTLFLNIVEILGQDDKQKMNYKFILNSKSDKDNVDICLQEGERLLREKEDLLNNTLLAIKSYQEKDGRFFSQVMDETKHKNKLQKHLLYKKNKMDKQFEAENKVIHKTNKVKLISRKTEAPYHTPQKRVKKVVNYEQIKRLEDEELLKYE